MRKEQSGIEDGRTRDSDSESGHEKNRRLKTERERQLRKQLSRLRPDRLDDEDIEA